MGALITDIGPYASILAVLGQIIFVWAWWSLKKSFVTLDAFNQHAAKSGSRAGSFEQRLATLENRLGSLAQPDIHPLELGLAELRGDIKALTRALAMQGEAMNRIEANTGQTMQRIEKHVHMLMQNEIGEGR